MVFLRKLSIYQSGIVGQAKELAQKPPMTQKSAKNHCLVSKPLFGVKTIVWVRKVSFDKSVLTHVLGQRSMSEMSVLTQTVFFQKCQF